MFTRPASTQRSTAPRAALAACLAFTMVAAIPTDVVDAGEARRTNPEPRAKSYGAPSYLHFGVGLCTRDFDPSVGNREIKLSNGALYINGDNDAETLVELDVDDQGTSTAWDDELVVTLSVWADGPDVFTTFTTPYWQSSEGAGIGGFATENVPRERSVDFVRFLGSHDEKNSVQNGTSLPMYASGWFGLLASGHDGFDGGGGPECVRGSNNDDRIYTRGGSDYVFGKYGDDQIVLGKGADTAEGGSDDDWIRGGAGADRIIGGDGSDCYDGGSGNDLLDDQHVSSTQIDQYTVDTTGGTDVITATYPQLVDACM